MRLERWMDVSLGVLAVAMWILTSFDYVGIQDLFSDEHLGLLVLLHLDEVQLLG